MIDINELRRKVNSTDVVDHIDLHANIKTVLSELLDRLEVVEKDVALKEKVIDALGSELNAVAKERDALRVENEALRAEVIHIKEVEFPRKAQAVADGWRGKCERLEAKIAEMEKQGPVAHVWRCDNEHIHGSSERFLPTGTKLYALPGAKGEEE